MLNLKKKLMKVKVCYIQIRNFLNRGFRSRLQVLEKFNKVSNIYFDIIFLIRKSVLLIDEIFDQEDFNKLLDMEEYAENKEMKKENKKG